MLETCDEYFNVGTDKARSFNVNNRRCPVEHCHIVKINKIPTMKRAEEILLKKKISLKLQLMKQITNLFLNMTKNVMLLKMK